MKKLLCPQCKIASVYVKNNRGDRLLAYVEPGGKVVARHPGDSLEGFDLDTVYCLGCSWSGSPLSMLERDY